MDEILAYSSDSDLELEDDEPVKRKKNSGAKHSAWIQEAPEEPLDLLDPKVSQKILMSNPKAHKRNKKEEFKTAPDGRLIIYDGNLSEEDDENDKVFRSLGIDKKTTDEKDSEKESKKRKIEYSDSEDDNAPPKKLAYKPGGKGIHRAREDEETGARFKFNSSVLNKRKKKKLSGQYKGLIKAAKKGAANGQKKKAKTRQK